MKTLKPLVRTMSSNTLRPKLSTALNDEHRRLQSEPWRRWYKTAKWQKLRWTILTRDLFTCQMCKRTDANTSQLVCDHVTPHKGDERMFWAGPFQTLCKQCHDSTKQSLEKGGGIKTQIALDGWPVEKT